MKPFLFCALLSVLAGLIYPAPVGYRNVEIGGMYYYAFAPGFPESHSIWSAIGITNKDQVYVGVSDHTVNVGLFHYNPNKNKMSYLGDVLATGKMWIDEWQGKIHTLLVQNPKDGLVYFGTDAGNSLWEFCGIPDQGFVGGHWFCIDPETDQVRNLGMGVKYLGLKSIAIDTVYNRIFATTDPSSHFIVYDIEKGKSPHYREYFQANQDRGCINGVHEPRMVWVDKWGNCYTVNHTGHLIMFEGATQEIRRLNVRIPFAQGTPTWHLAEGGAAMVSVNGGEYIYGVTYYGRMFKHVPHKKTGGKVIDLGHSWGDNNIFNENLKGGCLALGKNKKLYTVLGGHGRFVTRDSTAVLIEFDPKTRKKKVIYKFDKIVTECTGGVTDSKGNVYFAAHGQSVPSKKSKAIRKPWLVKFNPSKIKRIKSL
jgi:hypothetical protein